MLLYDDELIKRLNTFDEDNLREAYFNVSSNRPLNYLVMGDFVVRLLRVGGHTYKLSYKFRNNKFVITRIVTPSIILLFEDVAFDQKILVSKRRIDTTDLAAEEEIMILKMGI